ILRGVRQQQDEPGRFSICSRQAAVVHSSRRRFAARLNSGVSRTPTAPRKKETKPFLLPKRKTPYGGVLGKCVSTTPCRSQCHAVLFRRLLDANLSKIWHKLS
ncbi:hypothetical protein C5X63_005145, partial [Klebsiella pneumoniae subsp. pneumoniae]